MTSSSRCPCDLVAVPRHASRMCGGDFLTGAMWMESNKSACEFDSLSFQLCGATVSPVNCKVTLLLLTSSMPFILSCFFDTNTLGYD